MPEYEENDVSLKVSGDMLYIEAWNTYSFGTGDKSVYQRSFKLPADSNTKLVTARLSNDVLNIRIPVLKVIQQTSRAKRMPAV